MRHLYAAHCGVMPREWKTMVAKCNKMNEGMLRGIISVFSGSLSANSLASLYMKPYRGRRRLEHTLQTAQKDHPARPLSYIAVRISQADDASRGTPHTIESDARTQPAGFLNTCSLPMVGETRPHEDDRGGDVKD